MAGAVRARIAVKGASRTLAVVLIAMAPGAASAAAEDPQPDAAPSTGLSPDPAPAATGPAATQSSRTPAARSAPPARSAPSATGVAPTQSPRDSTAAPSSARPPVAKKARPVRTERRAGRSPSRRSAARRRSRTSAFTRSVSDSGALATAASDRRGPGARADGVPSEVAYGALALLVLALASGGLLALTVRLDREARGA
jgi:hypothetical protein